MNNNKKTSKWVICIPGVFLLFALLAANGQAADEKASGQQDEKSAASLEEQGADSSEFTSGKAAGLPYVLPDLYKRHLVSSFSLGHESQTRGGEETSRDTYTSVSASFAYNLQRKHSDYVFDYRGSGRRSSRIRQSDTFTHDLGLSQIVRLTPRLTWVLNHRFSYTPDFSARLVRENLARDASFTNQVPPGGISSNPAMVNPFPEFHSAVDGLDNTVRANRMTNSTTGNLIHQLSARTSLSFQAGFRRTRYSEGGLFDSNGYTVSARLSRMVTPRTSIGFNYQAGRFDSSGGFGRTINQGVGLSLNHQLTPSTTVYLSSGPSWITTNGQAEIPLSQVSADLLGRRALLQDSSRSFLSWTGTAGLAKHWQNLNIGLNYNRSTSSTNGLAGAATAESFAITLGRPLSRKTSVSVSVSYLRNELLGIQNAPRLDQQAISASLSHQLSQGLDVSMFFSYSKLLTDTPSTGRFNSNQFGVRFMYHFPRVTGS